MYVGVGQETGKEVADEDAFSYACERCRIGDAEEKQLFIEEASESRGMDDFVENLVERFYTGNWIYQEG